MKGIKATHFIPGPAIEYWKNSNDPMLIDLATIVEETLAETQELPPEKDLIEWLTFFMVFSMGLKEMQLDELSVKFSKRADQFIVGLSKMGLCPGQYKNYVQDKMLDGLYTRITNTAAYRAAYRMVELSRFVKEPKKEN